MKKIFLIVTITALIFNSSCKKNLDIPDPNHPTTQNFWKTANDAQLGINAIYSTEHREGYCRWLFFLTEIRSDEGYSTSPNADLINNFDAFNITDYNFGNTVSVWADSYIGINRCNQVLDNVPAIEMDNTLKAQYLAEAKFMRAFFYYNLAVLWGNVPFQLHTSKPTDLPVNSTQAQVFSQVEKDLTEASTDLPVSYDNGNIGRATKGAAFTLLGKAYLQEHKYQEAVNALKWLTEGDGKNVYDLMPNYRDNFVITTENNKESVFEFQYQINPNDTHDDDVAPGSDNLNYGTSLPPFLAPNPIGFTDGQARRWVIYEFLTETTTTGARDPRLAASYLFDSTDVRGPNFTIIFGQTFTQRGYPADLSIRINSKTVWFRKPLDDFKDNGESFHSGNNNRYLRYADVLLLYAEALNGINQTAAAYPFVDRVRQRAGLARLSDVMPGLNQQAFLNQLKHERITELSGEEHRWEDLARWGDLGPQLASRDAGFANFVKGKNEFLPLPGLDVDINPNLKQNPGF